jgi:hypothetical protein
MACQHGDVGEMLIMMERAKRLLMDRLEGP